MNSGDTREVAGIELRVGAAEVTVDVTATAAQILPTDSGERSAVLTTEDIEKLSLEGRNISELLKVLPGVTSVQHTLEVTASVENAQALEPAPLILPGANDSSAIAQNTSIAGITMVVRTTTSATSVICCA